MAKRKKSNTGHPVRKHHQKKHALHGIGDHTAHHPIVHTAVETGKDLLIGVVGGGLAGAAIGKSSLLAGILVTGAGHYMNNRYVQLVGIGMMASNGFQRSPSGTNGLDGIDEVKDRLMAYKDSFSQKFYLDKFLKKKPADTAMASAGMGEVQYFTYPDAMNGDLAALSDIESQLAASALAFQGHSAGDLPDISGDLPEVTGDIPETSAGDVEDRLY
ncbi:MAG TPA: hypothetical protein VF939_08965 [Puia sp.]